MWVLFKYKRVSLGHFCLRYWVSEVLRGLRYLGFLCSEFSGVLNNFISEVGDLYVTVAMLVIGTTKGS